MQLRTNKVDYNKKRLLITGAKGMLGQAIKRIVKDFPENCIYEVDLPIDLRNQQQAIWIFNSIKPDYVIHTAAKVGGIKANSDYLGDFYTDNIRININVLDAAKNCGVKKVLSLLSTCIYPDKVNYPLTEEQIHNGAPHISNYAYAYAKRMLDVQSQAYRDQFGCNFITAVPNNLFGKNDNFDLNNSHVIPAIIRKIYEAKINNTDAVMWGDGAPLREFTYVDDLAEILLFLLDEYDEREPINVGNTGECSIKNIAEIIAENLNYKGKLIWDENMPSGQFKKPSSNEKFKKVAAKYGKELEYTNIEKGLETVCKWFVENYPDVRGIK